MLEHHIKALFDAGTDKDKFRVARDNILSDKSLNLHHKSQIAIEYKNRPTGSTHQYKHKTLKHVDDAITDTFIGRRDREEKNKIIDRITTWPDAQIKEEKKMLTLHQILNRKK